MEIINATDGYKLGHHRMYPEGTEQVYSNWTPRSNKYFPEATEGSVVFGIQYLIKKYLIDEFNQNFFGLPKEKAIEMFYRRVHNFVGIESVGYRHIEALYDLGYLPIRIKALPEGQYYGAYYMLGKIFGWNTTSKDYRYPSTKIGLLYGDSITLERQKQIYMRLENAHMAACNLVLGVGSFSYQYASRDSLGFAIKATACVVNGELKEIFKHPKTDDGTKNSLKGLIAVYKGLDGKYTATDQVSIEEEKDGCLETVFEDGILKKEYSLEEIRQRIDHGL